MEGQVRREGHSLHDLDLDYMIMILIKGPLINGLYHLYALISALGPRLLVTKFDQRRYWARSLSTLWIANNGILLCPQQYSKARFWQFSSLHWIIFLSDCSFLYNGVYQVVLKLSICDVIFSQKGSNGVGKLHFFGRGQYFTCFLCAKIHLRANILNCTKRA